MQKLWVFLTPNLRSQSSPNDYMQRNKFLFPLPCSISSAPLHQQLSFPHVLKDTSNYSGQIFTFFSIFSSIVNIPSCNPNLCSYLFKPSAFLNTARPLNYTFVIKQLQELFKNIN